nr:PREDICTED: uncharacterized protein LOC109044063 isoform X1 [Bemisia tabaci]
MTVHVANRIRIACSTMDRLLERLRCNMAELSVQGDDYTRKIWHMYATFEELVDHHTGGAKPKEDGGFKGSSSGMGTRPEPQPPPVAPQSAPPRASIGGSFFELSGAGTTGDADAGASMSPQTSSLEFLGSGSKDDMSLEYRKPHYRTRYRRGRKRLGVSNPLLDTISSISWMQPDDEGGYGSHGSHKNFGPKYSSDFDRDSISYAGSNSIDSGYKSYCPTPEPSEGLYFEKRGSISSQCSQKPRIPMGTRVLNRNSMPQYYSTDDEQEHDSSLSFRHSLLSVESVGAGAGSGVLRPRSLSTSSAGGYRRPVSPVSQRSLRTSCPSCPSSRTHSPCYSGASGKSSPLYHRTKLPSDHADVGYLFSKRIQDDQVTALINVLDDSNRWTSVARVKNLKDNCRSHECSSSSESSCPSPSSNLPPGPEQFSDVARCILEIVEDLQKSGSTSIAGDTSPPAPAPSRGERPSSVSSTGLPTLDYHVYEEIMYDLMTSQAKAQSAPPPLPARPETLRKQAVPPGPGTSISAYAHSMTRQANQRSNIYSIFRDQGVRRGISESLEIEAQRPPATTSTSTRRPAPHPPDFLTDDEYGFLASRIDLNF